MVTPSPFENWGCKMVVEVVSITSLFFWLGGAAGAAKLHAVGSSQGLGSWHLQSLGSALVWAQLLLACCFSGHSLPFPGTCSLFWGISRNQLQWHEFLIGNPTGDFSSFPA